MHAAELRFVRMPNVMQVEPKATVEKLKKKAKKETQLVGLMGQTEQNVKLVSLYLSERAHSDV